MKSLMREKGGCLRKACLKVPTERTTPVWGFGPPCGHLDFVRDYGFGYDLGHHSSVGRPVAKSRGRGTGEWVGRGGRGRGPRGGNDERVDELNGQGNDQGEGANGNVEGVNEGVEGAPDFSTIIIEQLQNLLPAILAQVGNQGNVKNQNGNVVNENIQEKLRNVLVNGNWVGC
nr:hypothetical protein [Tanacetum cinerariifolium]